jgi:hypothetical protein
LTGCTVVLAIAATSIGVSPTVVVAATPEPAAPAAKPEEATPPNAPAEPAGAPKASGSPDAARSKSAAQCEHDVGVLAGREKDPKLLKEPGIRSLAARAPDVVTCAAVRADSDDACGLLEKEAGDSCLSTRAIFHELRAYPNGRSYLFDERKYRQCKQQGVQKGGMPVQVCDALQKALRSGDPAQCVINADFAAVCREAARAGTLDKQLDKSRCDTDGPQIKQMLEAECRALVNLDASACETPGPRHEEMAQQCRGNVDAGKKYGKGLKDLAESGSPRDQELAKAALDDPKACETFTKSAVDDCTAFTAAAAGAGTAPPTEQPKTPPPSPKPTSPPKG